jgi:hypothetical protein
MLDNGINLVVTVHKGLEMNSHYIKLSIEDNLEQLANFLVSVINCNSARIFSHNQDDLILEYKENKFYFDIEKETEIRKILGEAELILEGKQERNSVRIHNFWMDEQYNNIEQITKLIQKYELNADYSKWKDVVRR